MTNEEECQHPNSTERTSTKNEGPHRHTVVATTCDDCRKVLAVDTHTDWGVNN